MPFGTHSSFGRRYRPFLITQADGLLYAESAAIPLAAEAASFLAAISMKNNQTENDNDSQM
jgi:hypothetical protein